MIKIGKFNFLAFFMLISVALAEEKLKLAVFKVDSKLLGAEQSALLSEMLTAECSNDGRYEVVPWSEVGNALKMASDKSKLGEISSKAENMECTNSKCYDALGSLDVRLMVTARVEKPGRLLFMTLKLTDVEKMKQVRVISQKAENVDALFEAIPEYIKNLLSSTSDIQHEQDLKNQAEIERQKQLELEKQKQAELERQKQLELEKQKQAELERQRQLELERQKQLELEKQKQAELERQKQLEAQKNEAAKKAIEKVKSKNGETVLTPWLRWGGAGLTAVGLLYTYQQNTAAKKAIAAYDLSLTQAEMDVNWASIQKAKRGYWTGLGLMGLGAVSFGLSFKF